MSKAKLSNYEKALAATEKAFNNPKPGDYWHEMFSPVMVVLSAKPFIICDAKKDVGDGWYWDLTKAYEVNEAKCMNRLLYQTNAVSGTWARCSRRGHKKVVNDWKENHDSQYKPIAVKNPFDGGDV